MMEKSALKEYFPTFKKTLKGEMFFKLNDNQDENNVFTINKDYTKKLSIDLFAD